MEQGTCPPGSTQHDYCLAMDEEASIGCGDTRAFCPTEPYNFSSGVPVDAITCDRCAMVTMENWDQRIWLGGEVRWAPFARFEEDEMQLEGYNVGVLDACGVEIMLLGSVPVRSGMFAESVKECCANSWYAVYFGHYLPPESVSISITSWSGLAEDLRLATALPIFQATTSTTTQTSLTSSSTSSTTSSSTLSTTSWTDTTSSTTTSSSSSSSSSTSSSSSSSHTTFALAPAQLEGCIGLVVTDVDAFLAEPGATEAMRQTLAQAAGVRDTYIQQISLSEGSCDGAVTEVNDTAGARRLQSAVRTDYVVVFPAALGVEAALQAVEASRQALEVISLEEVTQILQEEVQRFPSIANIGVTVSTKAVTIEVTNDDAAGGVYYCTEEQRPHIDGAGEYTCTGNPGKGQKCTAPCSGSDISAEIICWSSREWLVTEPCLSQSEGMAAWLVFLIVFLCCLIVLLIFGLLFAVYTGACKKVTPEDDDAAPAPKDAWTATPPPSHASPRPASPDAPAPMVATGAADISFVTGLPWEAKRASSREERSRPSSREARSNDAPPVETVETLKTRSSRSRSPEAPKEQYLDSGLDGDAGQTTGAFSPGMPAQKETVTFMVDQQQDFRVWVQQDLPTHPLPQNTTVYPGTIQYD